MWDIWAQIVKVYYINIWKAQRVKLTWIKLGKFCNSEEKNKASSRISLDLVSYDFYLFYLLMMNKVMASFALTLDTFENPALAATTWDQFFLSR